MSKTKTHIITRDAEIDAAIAQATLYDEYRPKAVSAMYRAKGDVVVIEFATGVELAIPRMIMQGLENASPEQLADVTIVGAQSGLHWASLDVDHYVPSLIEGVFGNRRWMSALGKIGGAARTDAKRTASQRNGRKGGRPSKSSGTI